MTVIFLLWLSSRCWWLQFSASRTLFFHCLRSHIYWKWKQKQYHKLPHRMKTQKKKSSWIIIINLAKRTHFSNLNVALKPSYCELCGIMMVVTLTKQTWLNIFNAIKYIYSYIVSNREGVGWCFLKLYNIM